MCGSLGVKLPGKGSEMQRSPGIRLIPTYSTELDREEERDWRRASRGTPKGKVRTGGRKDRLEGG